METPPLTAITNSEYNTQEKVESLKKVKTQRDQLFSITSKETSKGRSAEPLLFEFSEDEWNNEDKMNQRSDEDLTPLTTPNYSAPPSPDKRPPFTEGSEPIDIVKKNPQKRPTTVNCSVPRSPDTHFLLRKTSKLPDTVDNPSQTQLPPTVPPGENFSCLNFGCLHLG